MEKPETEQTPLCYSCGNILGSDFIYVDTKNEKPVCFTCMLEAGNFTKVEVSGQIICPQCSKLANPGNIYQMEMDNGDITRMCGYCMINVGVSKFNQPQTQVFVGEPPVAKEQLNEYLKRHDVEMIGIEPSLAMAPIFKQNTLTGAPEMDGVTYGLALVLVYKVKKVPE